ncbi:MAG: hypothetical protein ACRDQZ_08035, partial [Mycobacteriales bacterium]
RETIDKGLGGWRFGLPAAKLIPYRKLKAAANIGTDMARMLERSARACGADPAVWYGSLTRINVSDCTVQRLEGDAWVDADLT